MLAKLQEEQASLSRNLNKKVMHMIEKVEGEYADLEAKLGTIENDKLKVRACVCVECRGWLGAADPARAERLALTDPARPTPNPRSRA